MATEGRREFNKICCKLCMNLVPCRAGFRSEPRYVISEDATLTKGVGAVTSLAGIVVFSESLLMASGTLSVCGWLGVWCMGYSRHAGHNQ